MVGADGGDGADRVHGVSRSGFGGVYGTRRGRWRRAPSARRAAPRRRCGRSPQSAPQGRLRFDGAEGPRLASATSHSAPDPSRAQEGDCLFESRIVFAHRSGPPKHERSPSVVTRAEVCEFVLRRLIVLVSALTLLIPSAVFAQNPSQADRFQPYPGAGTVDPSGPSQRDERLAASSPSCSRCAAIPSRSSSRRRRTRASRRRSSNQVKAELKARQDAIKGQHRCNGGRVLSQLQSAYNGIKVTVPRNKVAALASLPNVIAVRERPGRRARQPRRAFPSSAFPARSGIPSRGPRLHRRRREDRRHRHRHRLHARELRRPGDRGSLRARPDANDTTIGDAGDAGLFGPGAPKVKDGIDLVGDAYDGDADPARRRTRSRIRTPIRSTAPSPRQQRRPRLARLRARRPASASSPTATTYPGPYDATTPSTMTSRSDRASRRRPTSTSSASSAATARPSVTVEAIDWAVDHDVDVINMSLGSAFGRADDPSAVASTNAAAAGVSVVTSAGNSGPAPYITGSPGHGSRLDRHGGDRQPPDPAGRDRSTSPRAPRSPRSSANGITPPTARRYEVVVLTNDPATPENEALGCSVEAYTDAGIVEGGGQLAVTERGDCARVARADLRPAGGRRCGRDDQQRGRPPAVRGADPLEPGRRDPVQVTIPFLGVNGRRRVPMRTRFARRHRRRRRP